MIPLFWFAGVAVVSLVSSVAKRIRRGGDDPDPSVGLEEEFSDRGMDEMSDWGDVEVPPVMEDFSDEEYDRLFREEDEDGSDTSGEEGAGDEEAGEGGEGGGDFSAAEFFGSAPSPDSAQHPSAPHADASSCGADAVVGATTLKAVVKKKPKTKKPKKTTPKSRARSR
jgi:hypothetical protein